MVFLVLFHLIMLYCMIFEFDTAVSQTSIELDLFNCPEWNIGAPVIAVHGERVETYSIQTLTILGSSYNQIPIHHVTLCQLFFIMMLQLQLTSQGILYLRIATEDSLSEVICGLLGSYSDVFIIS